MRAISRQRKGWNAGPLPLAKTARWVILPTCSYSYEHAVLLITSNYNTWSQCILRYANLVSRPLVLTPVALEEGKWDKWAATNRIMHKRSRFPEDISPSPLFTWKTLWEIGPRISMLVYRCTEIQPIFMTAVDRNAVDLTAMEVESLAHTGRTIHSEIYFVDSLTLSKKAFNVLKIDCLRCTIYIYIYI